MEDGHSVERGRTWHDEGMGMPGIIYPSIYTNYSTFSLVRPRSLSMVTATRIVINLVILCTYFCPITETNHSWKLTETNYSIRKRRGQEMACGALAHNWRPL